MQQAQQQQQQSMQPPPQQMECKCNPDIFPGIPGRFSTTDYLGGIGVSPDSGIEFDRWTPADGTDVTPK